jgi:hypothetical protein
MTSNSFVHTNGTHFVNPDGSRLRLCGTNLGNWLLLEGYMFQFQDGPQSNREIEGLFMELAGPEVCHEFWQQYLDCYIAEADIQFLHRCGCNCLRFPLHYKYFETDDSQGFRLLDRAIGWCRDAGMHVVLDLHAAPGGQNGSNIGDGWGYPWLFASPSAERHCTEIWQRLATHYRDDHTVIGYDLLNEPIPHYPGLEKYNPLLEPLYRRLTAAIREIDKNHILFLGGAQWNKNFKVFGEPFDDNTAYTFHQYWVEPDISSIREFLDYRDKYKVPLWCGESGENSDEWVAAFRKLLDLHEIDWTFWPYKKMAHGSGCVTFPQPVHWDKIVAYGKLPLNIGQLEKKFPLRPAQDDIRACLADFLHQIRFENCRVNRGYLEALGLTPPSNR